MTYYATAATTGTNELRAFRVAGATCNASQPNFTDQCFRSASDNTNAGTTITSGTENFGMQIVCLENSSVIRRSPSAGCYPARSADRASNRINLLACGRRFLMTATIRERSHPFMLCRIEQKRQAHDRTRKIAKDGDFGTRIRSHRQYTKSLIPPPASAAPAPLKSRHIQDESEGGLVHA